MITKIERFGKTLYDHFITCSLEVKIPLKKNSTILLIAFCSKTLSQKDYSKFFEDYDVILETMGVAPGLLFGDLYLAIYFYKGKKYGFGINSSNVELL